MTTLTIAPGDLKILLGIAPGDTTQDAALSALISQQQPALEFALDGSILAATAGNAGLLATLKLGVCEVMAGVALAAQGRALAVQALTQQSAFQASTIKVSTFEVTTRPLIDPQRSPMMAQGVALAEQGLARLGPYSKAARSLAASVLPAGTDPQGPVPQLLGLGQSPGIAQAAGPPTDPTFDDALGVDGGTEPPSGDVFSPITGGLGGFDIWP